MIFETKNLYVRISGIEDLKDLAEIYNTNLNFIKVHLNKKEVCNKWIISEMDSMNKMGFLSCLIYSKEAREPIGLIDFKEGEKASISLVMIKRIFKNRGFGVEVYEGLEKYLRGGKTQSIKLEVVNNYSEEVMEFWRKRGFNEKGEVTIKWQERTLKAISLEKILSSGITEFEELYEIAKEKAIGKELSKNAYVGSVAAVIVSESGKIYTGVSLDANCALGFCAEVNAIGKMISNGESEIKKLVAVHHTGKIMPPCGKCRELISQLNEENYKCEILLEEETIKTLKELLPYNVY